MRIWSIHPKYLDSKGLVALWRETLLAKNVLENKTKGYKNHSQLLRFKDSKEPLSAINCYLLEVYNEACVRGYNFNKEKIGNFNEVAKIPVTEGQLKYEQGHLLKKLKERDVEKYKLVKEVPFFDVHPLFYRIDGDVESWEKIIE